MQRLAPALRAAFDLSRALADAQAWQLRAGGLLEAFEMPAVVVDSRRVPRLANKAAEVLLAGGELLRQDARRRLGTCSVSATTELVQCLSAMSRPGEVVRGQLTVRDSLGVPLALISSNAASGLMLS